MAIPPNYLFGDVVRLYRGDKEQKALVLDVVPDRDALKVCEIAFNSQKAVSCLEIPNGWSEAFFVLSRHVVPSLKIEERETALWDLNVGKGLFRLRGGEPLSGILSGKSVDEHGLVEFSEVGSQDRFRRDPNSIVGLFSRSSAEEVDLRNPGWDGCGDTSTELKPPEGAPLGDQGIVFRRPKETRPSLFERILGSVQGPWFPQPTEGASPSSTMM